MNTRRIIKLGLLAVGTWIAATVLRPAHAAQVTIALVGDSTVSTYKSSEPLRGWGQIIPDYIDRAQATVTNYAAPGRSTKTFKSEGRWAKVLAAKPTYVLIQFGHNDSHDPDRPESTSADGDYTTNLREYIATSRAAGIVPVLVTPMHRGTWTDAGHLTPELTPYANAMRRVATELNVPLIDLYPLSDAAYLKIGQADLDTIFAHAPSDRTHFNEKGARMLALVVAQEAVKAVPALKGVFVLPDGN